jgi:nucleotide-binding universal stress UspA family protein
MKTILLPTDFSENSERALEFAIGIAKLSNAKIIAVNAYYIPIIDLNVPPSIMDELYESEEKEIEKKLKEICKKISLNTSITGKKITSEYITEQNIPAVEISKIAKEKEADLIIMGRDSQDDFWGFFGSTTTDALEKVECPILVVKENSKFIEFKNIYFALEDIKEDLTTIEQIIPFAKIFNAEITIVHVDKYAENIEDLYGTEEKREKAETLVKVTRRYTNYSKINLHSVLADDTIEGLNNFLKIKKIDLWVLLKYDRRWIETIFHISVIKNLLKEDNTPLLIIHKNPKLL